MNVERFEKPFFLGLCAFAFILVLLVFLPEINALVLGAAFAIFFHPIYVRFLRKMPQHEWLAALLTVLLAAIVIVVPLFIFGYQLVAEAEGLYTHLAAGGITSLENLIRERLGSVLSQANQTGGVFTLFNVNFGQYVTQFVGGIVSNAGNILARTGDVVWTFFLAFFAFFYLLKDGEKLRKLIVRSLPLANGRAEEIVDRLVSMAISVVRGSLFMAIVWGLVVGIEFLAFGVPNPVFWGAISILAAFIPVIGVSLVIIPGILYVALTAGIVKAVVFAVIAFIISAFMESMLHPLVIGHGRHIHPFVLLLSVLGGISFFGPIGLFLGPLVLSFFLTLFEIYPTLITES